MSLRLKRMLLLMAIQIAISGLAACEPSDATRLKDAYLSYISRLQECGVMSEGRLNVKDLNAFVESAPDGLVDGFVCHYGCLASIPCATYYGSCFSTDGDSDSSMERAGAECSLKCFPKFDCGGGMYMLIFEKCDGNEDCPDGSDEVGCPEPEMLECANGDTYDTYSKCDGYDDCSDGSDESDCPEPDTFTCANGQKVLARDECDGNDDCDDGSDETGCAHSLCTED